MGGNNIISAEAHKARGTYRADRHGERAAVTFAASIPDMPDDLGEHGTKLWQTYVACAPESLLTQIDRSVMADACRTWQRICQLQAVLRDDPLELKVANSLVAAQRIFQAYSARLGLSPVDRSRLKGAPRDESKDDPYERLRKKQRTA